MCHAPKDEYFPPLYREKPANPGLPDLVVDKAVDVGVQLTNLADDKKRYSECYWHIK